MCLCVWCDLLFVVGQFVGKGLVCCGVFGYQLGYYGLGCGGVFGFDVLGLQVFGQQFQCMIDGGCVDLCVVKCVEIYGFGMDVEGVGDVEVDVVFGFVFCFVGFGDICD